MEVDIYTRHTPECPYREDKLSRKCKCRKWLYLSPSRQRISAGTRSWAQAEEKAKQILRNALKEATAKQTSGKTIAEAAKLFLEDKHEQGISTSWERKFTRELPELVSWSKKQGLLTLTELSLEHLEQFRKTWPGVAITRSKRQERLRSFFTYCIRHKWVDENVAANLSKIKVPHAPTQPISKEQFQATMHAAAVYNPKAPDSEWRRQRAIAMLLLLRWSGLRLGDAARMERKALSKDGNLRLYMMKTGEGVYVRLKPEAVEALNALHNPNPKYFFWNGTSSIEGPVKRWWSTLKKIFIAAGIQDAHPHMLRDTFAVELLLIGTDIKLVSTLLGHSSVIITEKHYAPWIRARQTQLDESVMKSWAS